MSDLFLALLVAVIIVVIVILTVIRKFGAFFMVIAAWIAIIVLVGLLQK